MKKIIFCTFLFFLSVSFTNCECDGSECPMTLTEDSKRFLPNEAIGASIKFKNAQNESISFLVNDKTIKRQNERTCKNINFQCKCYGCATLGRFDAKSSTSINEAMRYISSVSETGEACDCPDVIQKTDRVSINFYDFYTSANITENKIVFLKIKEDTLTLRNHTLGNKIYPTLHLVSKDTLIIPSVHINQVYFTPEFEVVGFYNRVSKQLFFKE